MLDNGYNLAATQPGLAFVIENRGDGPVVEWFAEPIQKDADTVLRELAEAQAEMRDPERSAMRRECEKWLRETLSCGPVSAKEVIHLGKEAGYTHDQVKRAKLRIKVHSEKKGFDKDTIWVWSLPDASADGLNDYEERTIDRREQPL
jgi:hypothetical protein